MSNRGKGKKAFDKKTIQASFTGHLTGLPQDILSLFHAGPSLLYLRPVTKKKLCFFGGVAKHIKQLEETPNSVNNRPVGKYFINKEYQHQVRLAETLLEKKTREDKERLERQSSELLVKAAHYDPTTDPNVQGEPFKTLFVGRLSRNATERKLRKEFEVFGSLSRIRIVLDKLSGKPRGYAFIEFDRPEDMKRAYKMGMNRVVEGTRIITDVERGRTVAHWKPKRLGGITHLSRVNSVIRAVTATSHCDSKSLSKKASTPRQTSVGIPKSERKGKPLLKETSMGRDDPVVRAQKRLGYDSPNNKDGDRPRRRIGSRQRCIRTTR